MITRNLIQVSNLLVGCTVIFMLLSLPALAHEGEGQSAASNPTAVDNKRDETLKLAIKLLNELIETRKANGEKFTLALNSGLNEADSKEEVLRVWVELHSNQTHAHVKRPGVQEESWLLEGIKYTEEEAVIKAIADKSGLKEHDIEEIIVFPSGVVDENGDSVEEFNTNTDQDVSGIHIMNNGKIMWGNGTEVHDATLTADGKVKLPNGTIITPAFDLR